MTRLLLAALLAAPAANDSYRAEIERWRQDVERSLKADDGWLTVAGLFWLAMGVPAVRVSTAEEFRTALAEALAAKGPRLIEALL